MEELAQTLGAPRYRGRQLAQWIFVKGVTDLDAMTDLPRDFRAALAAQASVGVPEVERRTPSQDGSQKLVLRYDDGARVQAVLMPDADRLTLCVSTQVGCGFGCAFCYTGTMGLERNLSAGEIVGQVMAAREGLAAGLRITHIVYMGMGEPLANYTATVKSLRLLTDPQGLRVLAPPHHGLHGGAGDRHRAPGQGKPPGQPRGLAPRHQQRDPRPDHAGQQAASRSRNCSRPAAASRCRSASA